MVIKAPKDHMEGRVIQVSKAEMVHMVLPDSPEMLVPLEAQDLKDYLVIKVVMQLLKTALTAHHTVTPRDTKVLLVHQEILVSLVDQADQVILVSLVDAYLVYLEHLEVMVNQVMMESTADLVDPVSLEHLEMLLASGRVPVLISLLA